MRQGEGEGRRGRGKERDGVLHNMTNLQFSDIFKHHVCSCCQGI